MIFYFSGTGNSRWAAGQIAALTGDRVQDLAGLEKAPDLTGEARVGLVFPIYAWGAPEPVLAFAASLPRTEAFSFAVCTCGAEAGLAMKKLAGVYPFASSYSLVMPNNYLIGSETDDRQTALGKIAAAREDIQVLAREVLARTPVYRVREGAHPGLKSGVVNFGFNRFARTTKSFSVSDACVGCGLCARNCPAGTITLQAGRPVWGKRCFQCLRCISTCPQEAIQYGKATRGRRRYTIDRCLGEAGEAARR